MKRVTRYPLSVESAAPGKLVRTRTRHVSGTSPVLAASDTSGTGTAASANAVPYLGRALLPLPSSIKQQSTYTIQAGDRLDNISTKLLGDPLLYWMLCEANGTSDPATLCAIPGRKIVVPAGVGQGANPFDEPQATKRGSAARPVDHSDDGDENP